MKLRSKRSYFSTETGWVDYLMDNPAPPEWIQWADEGLAETQLEEGKEEAKAAKISASATVKPRSSKPSPKKGSTAA